MALVTLAEVKAHLRIIGSDADGVLGVFIAAAGDYLGRIGCPVDADPPSPTLKAAALFGVQQMYAASGDIAETKEQVPGVATIEYDRNAADRILSAAVDRLVAAVREVAL